MTGRTVAHAAAFSGQATAAVARRAHDPGSAKENGVISPKKPNAHARLSTGVASSPRCRRKN